MRGTCATLWLLVATVATSHAAPPTKVPATVTAKTGQMVRIVPVVDKGATLGIVTNFSDEDAFFDMFGAPNADGSQKYVFQASKAGTYVIALYTVGDKTGGTITIITVVDPAPPVTPVPPTPPAPPLPPLPTDAFSVSIQAAYTADTDANKANSVAQLAALYRQMSTNVTSDTSLKTFGDVFTDLSAASAALDKSGSLLKAAIPKTRAAVGARLTTSIGSKGSTAIDRTFASVELATVATALEAVR